MKRKRIEKKYDETSTMAGSELENLIEVTKVNDKDLVVDKWEREIQIINGWGSVEDCAATVWNSIHSTLLDGELVYGYKRTNEKSDLQQLVIVKNRPGAVNSFALGMVTTTYSVLYPEVSFDYLANEIVQDMKNYKVDKDIIENYLKVLEFTKEKYYGEEI